MRINRDSGEKSRLPATESSNRTNINDVKCIVLVKFCWNCFLNARKKVILALLHKMIDESKRVSNKTAICIESFTIYFVTICKVIIAIKLKRTSCITRSFTDFGFGAVRFRTSAIYLFDSSSYLFDMMPLFREKRKNFNFCIS